MNIERHLSGFLRAPDGDGAGAGAGAGAAAAAGAGAAAAAGAGGGQGQQQQQQQKPFYGDWNLDDAGVKFITDRSFDGPASIIKSAIESDRVARSRNVIDKPDPLKLGDWSGYTELGWTADRKAYQVAKPEKTGAAFDETEFNQFVDVAHKHKVAPWQAQAIFADMAAFGNQTMLDLHAKADGELKAASDALEKKWGNDHAKNTDLARRAMTKFGGHLKVEQIESAMGVPGLVELMANLGAAMGEDAFQGASGGGGFGDMTADQAAAEVRKLHSDPNWMKVFTDPRHPQHNDYVAQRARLIEIEAKGRRAA